MEKLSDEQKRAIKNLKQREYRLVTKNIHTRQYEKTKSGFIVRLYRNMKTRVFNTTQDKFKAYTNKELLSKESFYDWINNNQDFHLLFENYEKNNYDRKLAPSVDRINPKLGYSLDNMRMISSRENSILGNRGKRKQFLVVQTNTVLDGYEELANHLNVSYHSAYNKHKNNNLKGINLI